ncbi:54S ribosomal protein L27, mitochondrial [[Candida] jaroonii]|uniref:54S ribosomal protein L27, mitochondrial n=1 Tax=[Candida] jaroonii TaxID=467808 RepID=A0ACA9Y5A1_9ASCO|nr:54S ribosomal protein L27, mitochondrial [[Candida] jaroonii]
MKPSTVLGFQSTAVNNLRRPWQTFKNGELWYGLTKLGSKRHPLTTKQGNKNFYKGTGSAGMGKLDKYGNFIVNWSKVRTYVVPTGLNQTSLKPLVSPEIPQIESRYVGYADGPKDVELAWKNIKDFIELGENYDYKDLDKTDYLEEFVNPKVVVDELPEEITK